MAANREARISERSRNERRLLETRNKDPLTGCYTRPHLQVFEEAAEPAAAQVQVGDEPQHDLQADDGDRVDHHPGPLGGRQRDVVAHHREHDDGEHPSHAVPRDEQAAAGQG